MNRITLIGNVSSGIELLATRAGAIYGKFQLAVQREPMNAGEEPETDFFDVIAGGDTGEFVYRYLGEGNWVMVDGRVRTRCYGTQNGSKLYAAQVIAEHVERCFYVDRFDRVEECVNDDLPF